jgi:hypothetical protein
MELDLRTLELTLEVLVQWVTASSFPWRIFLAIVGFLCLFYIIVSSASSLAFARWSPTTRKSLQQKMYRGEMIARSIERGAEGESFSCNDLKHYFLPPNIRISKLIQVWWWSSSKLRALRWVFLLSEKVRNANAECSSWKSTAK